MPSAIFFDGVENIGGTKILLSGKGSHVFLEFGINFQEENRYFEWPTVTPGCVEDYLKTGLLPRSQKLREIRVPYRYFNFDSKLDGVLVSHAHMDHYGRIPLLGKDTDVYLGEATKDFINIRNESRSQTTWKNEINHLDFHSFTTKDNNVEVSDEISFNPVHVDHSIPAAYGFIITIDGKNIAYTGDLRMHGYKSNFTEDFLNQLEDSKGDTLICEGTNLTDSNQKLDESDKYPKMVDHDCETEDEVKKEVTKVAEGSEKLIVAETSQVDVDRIRSLWKAAEETKKEFVMDPKIAYTTFMAKFSIGIENLPAPWNSSVWLRRKKDKNVDTRISDEWDLERKKYRYDRDKTLVGNKFADEFLSFGRESSIDVEGKKDDTDINGEKKEWAEKLNSLEDEENIYWGKKRDKIRESPSDYLMCTSNATKTFLELYTPRKQFSCEFLLSKSEPFTEEMKISFNKLLF